MTTRSKQISLSARRYRRIAVARNVWKLAQREYARIGDRAAADHGHNVMNALAMNQQLSRDAERRARKQSNL
jgi:hypothetical protein